MQSFGPTLTEPGTTYFLKQTLKQCHTKKIVLNDNIVNLLKQHESYELVKFIDNHGVSTTDVGDDDYRSYFNGEKIKPKAGRMCMFPPMWTHLHSGNVVMGTKPKYIIGSYLHYV